MTDLDGDGDTDLFASWDSSERTKEDGWTIALNDGDGAFETVRTEEIGSGAIEVIAGDLTGDGKDETVVMSRLTGVPKITTEVWSIGPDLQLEMLIEIDDRWLIDVADWDGDGDVELFVAGHTTLEGSTLEVWELEVWDVENGMWTSSEVVVTENYVAAQIGDFTGDGMLEVLWSPIHGQANTRIVGALGDELQSGDIFEYDAGKRVLGVGDFDGDGQVDMLTSLIRVRYEGLKGLVLQRGVGGRNRRGTIRRAAVSAFVGDGARLGRRRGGGLGVCRRRPRLGTWGVCRMGWRRASNPSSGKASPAG